MLRRTPAPRWSTCLAFLSPPPCSALLGSHPARSTPCWLNGRPANHMASNNTDPRPAHDPITSDPAVKRRPRLNAAQLIQPPPPTANENVDATQGGQVRVRQHVNPLARKWSQPVVLPNEWYATAFADVSLPLVIDIGVAKGRFIYKMANLNPTKCNYLGLEIREPLVHQANRVAADAGLRNVFYIACNANVSFGDVVRGVPDGVLRDVYVQFCDPWFKKRHAKRRMLNPDLVDGVHAALTKSQGCNPTLGKRTIFMQSDVLEIAREMRAHVDAHGGFQRTGIEQDLPVHDGGWLVNNPVGVETEREIAVRNKNGNVYRSLFYCKTGNSLSTG